MSDTYERLGALLTKRCGVRQERLEPGATFGDLGLDSMDYVTLAMALQKEFGVEMDEDDLLPGDTLASSVTLLETKLATG